jgi:hypothetical protein
MANVVVNKFKLQSMEAGINLTAAGTLKCALIQNIFGTSSTTQIADVQSFSSVQAAWEVSGTTNYTAGGMVLSGATVTEDDVGDKSVFDANDVTWATATVTAYGAVIYRASDSLPICFVDFSGAKTSTAGDFTIQWNANGIVTLT